MAFTSKFTRTLLAVTTTIRMLTSLHSALTSRKSFTIAISTKRKGYVAGSQEGKYGQQVGTTKIKSVRLEWRLGGFVDAGALWKILGADVSGNSDNDIPSGRADKDLAESLTLRLNEINLDGDELHPLLFARHYLHVLR